jgi:hypothetical protein
MDHVAQGDAEQLAAADLDIAPGSVDCLVYGDVLEHLVDPWALLRRQAAWLHPDGMVLACVPNVQHWTMFVRLLRGNWQYEDEGLLDRTHLRFFTLDSIAELFGQAGLHVFDVQGRLGNPADFQQFQNLFAPLVRSLGLDAERFTRQTAALQYVVRARRSPVPPRRVVMHTLVMEHLACGRVRVQEPDSFLSTIPGFQATSSVKSAQLPPVPPPTEKIFVLQRAILGSGDELRRMKQLLSLGYLLVAEMDDDPLRFPEHPETNFLTFRAVHCVQTSTEALAECLRQYNPNVAAFPNQLAHLPPPRGPSEGGPVRLFFGALNRQDDWQPILPALNRVLQEQGPRLQVQVIHDQQFFEALQTQAKTFEPFCPYPRYEELLRRCDVAILPLEANRFNSMKSDLKWLECAAHGVVALASPTVYGRSVVPGETGLLYRSAKEFEEQLRELIGNRDLRGRVARKAYAWVKNKRLLAQHYRTRYEWYLRMLDRLPELTEELRRRVPELA